MTSEPPTAPNQFTLSAPPPVRGLAVAAGLTVVGAGLLVLTSVVGWPVWVAIAAVVVIVLGVALAVAALLLTARVRTVVHTDDQQISVSRAGRSASARWVSVAEVTLVGCRLTLSEQQGDGGVEVFNLRSRSDPTFLALTGEIQRRLDASRGYGSSLR